MLTDTSAFRLNTVQRLLLFLGKTLVSITKIMYLISAIFINSLETEKKRENVNRKTNP